MRRREGEQEIRLWGTWEESWWDRQKDWERDTLSSESLGTTHCCHYITLHYIHQPLHLWSCGRAGSRWLGLSAAAAKTSSFRTFPAMLLPLLSSLPFTAVFKATCVTLNQTKSVWSQAEVFHSLLWQWVLRSRGPDNRLWITADPCLNIFSCILQIVKWIY